MTTVKELREWLSTIPEDYEVINVNELKIKPN
jgi:hypothetical protein